MYLKARVQINSKIIQGGSRKICTATVFNHRLVSRAVQACCGAVASRETYEYALQRDLTGRLFVVARDERVISTENFNVSDEGRLLVIGFDMSLSFGFGMIYLVVRVKSRK